MPRLFPRLAPAFIVFAGTSAFLALHAEPGPSAVAANPAPAAEAADAALDLDRVVVTVDGVPITEREVIVEADERVNIYAAESLRKGLIYDESSRPATRDFFRDDVLNLLVGRLLTAKQLEADGITITEADVDAAFDEKLRERGQTRAEAEAEIAEQGKTMACVRARIRWNNLAVRRLYEHRAAERRRFTETEARLLYQAAPAEYRQQHERRVSRILFIATSEHDAARHAQAKAHAEQALVRLRSGGDFAAVARELSEDSLTRSRGGDLGWSPRGFVNAPGNDPFGDAAFALGKVGDMTGVVQTLDGYEVILLTGLREERQKTFDEVKREIIAKKEYNYIGDFWDRFVGEMKKKADIRWSDREIARREKEARLAREALARQEAEGAIGMGGHSEAAPPPDYVRQRATRALN